MHQSRAALRALAELDLATLSDAQLLDTLAAVAPLVCQAQAVQTRLIGAAHVRGAAAVDGAASTVSWLRNRLLLGEAGNQVRVAVGLSTLPHVEQAYSRGELSFAHVAALTDVARDIHPEVLAAGADKLLAEQAVGLPPGPARRMANRVRDHFDPEAGARRTRRIYGQSWLNIDTTFEGAVSIQGVLDPDGGRLVQATLAALTPPPRPGDTRPGGARRAEALVRACRLAGAVSPQAGGAKPQLVVTVDWPTLRDGLTPRPGDGASLDNRVPVSPATARRLACDATLIPALLGSAGQPLDIGRATRIVPVALRRALVLRDQTCRFPHCDRPPGWTDAHHVVPWVKGGPTALRNLILLCRHHHTLVHEGGWSIRFDPTTNTVTAQHRSGRRHTSRPRSP